MLLNSFSFFIVQSISLSEIIVKMLVSQFQISIQIDVTTSNFRYIRCPESKKQPEDCRLPTHCGRSLNSLAKMSGRNVLRVNLLISVIAILGDWTAVGMGVAGQHHKLIHQGKACLRQNLSYSHYLFICFFLCLWLTVRVFLCHYA